MSCIPDLRLLDCGDGRRLDRAGELLLDRPAPAAQNSRDPQAPWQEAHFCYTGASMSRGVWKQKRDLPEATAFSKQAQTSQSVTLPAIPIEIEGLEVELRLTPSGQIGIFPEQRKNWRMLQGQRKESPTSSGTPKPRLLNLFAYTGLSTLAALKGGYEVCHVDAARSVVRWARFNAELSGLADHPVRWITEDALRFCEREVRRGNSYEAFVLDPPAFGRGPKKERWLIERDLPRLLALLCELSLGRPQSILLSAHETGWNAQTLRELLSTAFVDLEDQGTIETYRLEETAASGAQLSAGFCVSFTRAS